MIRLLTLSATAICCAACFGFATPTAAKDYEYRRRAITSYMLQCGFDTLSQCQDMSFGRGGDCLRNPSLGSAAARTPTPRASARPLSTHRFTRNSKKSTPGSSSDRQHDVPKAPHHEAVEAAQHHAELQARLKCCFTPRAGIQEHGLALIPSPTPRDHHFS